MTATKDQLATAARMGKRRGELFRDTGVPTPNPFKTENVADLAMAWRHAYFSAAASKKK